MCLCVCIWILEGESCRPPSVSCNRMELTACSADGYLLQALCESYIHLQYLVWYIQKQAAFRSKRS